MENKRRGRIFPGIVVGLILLLIGSAILQHLFFPFYYGGYYPWHPFFPWGGFFFLRGLLFFGLLFFLTRRFFWGRRWAYAGHGFHGRYGGYTHDYAGPCNHGQFQQYRPGAAPFEKSGNRASDDFIELVSGFGTVEKKVNSKNFQGGDVTTIMGQVVIDLRDADFAGTVRLKVVQVQGTTTIVVPRNWEVKAGEGTVFATFQDSQTDKAATDPDKVLVIDGTCFMGGIEVRMN